MSAYLCSAFVRCLLLAMVFCLSSRTAIAQSFDEARALGLPEKTVISKLGHEVVVNGLPMQVVGIAVPDSIKNTASFFLDRWGKEGWRTNLQRDGDLIIVSAMNDRYQKVATLTKTGEAKTEGSISLTDLPARLAAGKAEGVETAKHLPKPLNSVVLNEVLVRDDMGESIMTTLMNGYSVEQNVAFYRERMFELGWKETKNKAVVPGKASVLVFERPGKEANFTMSVQKGKTFITVNWLSK